MQMLEAVLPVIVILLIGSLCREKKIISDEGVQSLQALVMNITLPATLFGNFYSKTISADQLTFPIVCFGIVAGGVLIGKLVCRMLKITDPFMPFMTAGYEVGMLGFALLAILIGSENITTFAIMDVGHELAIFTVYLAMLKAANGEGQSVKDVIKGIFTTPVLLAILAGAILGMSGIGSLIVSSGFGTVVDAVCSFAAAPTGAVILIVIGYRMNFKSVKLGRILKAICIRIVEQLVLAALVFGLFAKLGGVFMEKNTLVSVILLFILPPPFIIPLFIENEEKKEFYSSALSVYTLITIVGFSIMAALLFL